MSQIIFLPACSPSSSSASACWRFPGAIPGAGAQGHALPSLAIATLRLGLAALDYFALRPVAVAARAAGHLPGARIVVDARRGVLPRAAFRHLDQFAGTPVASSTALVTTNLIWIAFASFLLFREPEQRCSSRGKRRPGGAEHERR